MKNKEWLKEQLSYLQDGVGESFNDYSKGLNAAYNTLEILINELDEPDQDINVAYDLLAKITTLSQEDFDLYWNCINDGVAIRDLEQEKVVIPQFVADFIEEVKPNFNIRAVFTLENDKHEQGQQWALDNPDLFARAWINGYSVEKQSKYLVKVNDQGSWLYLKSMSLYKDVERRTDLNSNLEAWKEKAIRFSNKEQAEGIAKFFGGEIEEITK